jgi:TPR repeat protein
MDGKGVPKDYVEAYKYFSVAGAPNNASWAAERLTPADLGRAKEAVRVWHLEHPNPQIAANPHVK